MSCYKWWDRRCLRQFVYGVVYIYVREVYVNVYNTSVCLQNVLVRYVCVQFIQRRELSPYALEREPTRTCVIRIAYKHKESKL